MIVEFVGISGTGKSHFSNQVIIELENRGIQTKAIHLQHFKVMRQAINVNPTLQHIASDFLALPYVPFLAGAQWEFLAFAWKMLTKYSDSNWIRVNYFRNIVRLVCTHERLSRFDHDNRMVIVDEGTVQSVHPTFVHLSGSPLPGEIGKFASLVPMPDVIILLKVPIPVLIERIIHRKDRPVKVNSNMELRKFVEHAQVVFDALFEQKALMDRTYQFELGEVEHDSKVVKEIVDQLQTYQRTLTSQRV